MSLALSDEGSSVFQLACLRSRVGQCRRIPPFGFFNGARCLGEHLFYGTPLVQFQRHLGLESPFLLGQLFGCSEFMCRERRRHGGRMTLLSILECSRDVCEPLLEIDASRSLERDARVVLSPLGVTWKSCWGSASLLGASDAG